MRERNGERRERKRKKSKGKKLARSKNSTAGWEERDSVKSTSLHPLAYPLPDPNRFSPPPLPQLTLPCVLLALENNNNP
ncbi:hypothetical protein TNCT_485591 [Trichonephila clavata]|uniref:Uncharacterized protein n=1 Tax=Trichonephila clavata TaxID=2740835 RepID=A0A8X6LQN3_TRICU|nr:hypothetical protein TNCT_485591 [Trichonephila clavata]